jgi:hypothetical protein
MRTLLALLMTLSAGAAAPDSLAGQPRPSPTEFLRRILRLPDLAAFKTAEVDLKGDGRREIIAYPSDRRLCGSGGCTTFILAPSGASYRVMMRATVVWLPIRRLASSSHGWRDIGVMVGGGGITHPYEAALRFDGRRYPSNPTVPPAIRLRRVEGEVLLAR